MYPKINTILASTLLSLALTFSFVTNAVTKELTIKAPPGGKVTVKIPPCKECQELSLQLDTLKRQIEALRLESSSSLDYSAEIRAIHMKLDVMELILHGVKDRNTVFTKQVLERLDWLVERKAARPHIVSNKAWFVVGTVILAGMLILVLVAIVRSLWPTKKSRRRKKNKRGELSSSTNHKSQPQGVGT